MTDGGRPIKLTQQIKKVARHTRVMGISAATGERVKELMQRVRKVGISTYHVMRAHSTLTLLTRNGSAINALNPPSCISAINSLTPLSSFPTVRLTLGGGIAPPSFPLLLICMQLFH